MVVLTNVKIHIGVRDGVDYDSLVIFQLYHLTEDNIIATHSDSGIENDKFYEKDLSIVNNTFDKSKINDTTFYLEINANGHDKFSGNLEIHFSYSDGTKNSFNYGKFEIGTFKMSNTTRKSVTNVKVIKDKKR